MEFFPMTAYLLNASELEIGRSDLEQPVSLTMAGDVATLRMVISALGAAELRTQFAIQYNATDVRPVSSLRQDELRGLAALLLKDAPGGTKRGSAGMPILSPQQLREEVLSGSSIGEDFVKGFKLHALLLEAAAIQGRLKLVDVSPMIGNIPLEF